MNAKKPSRFSERVLRKLVKRFRLECENALDRERCGVAFGSVIGLASFEEDAKIVVDAPAGADGELGRGFAACPILLVLADTSSDAEVVGDAHIGHQEPLATFHVDAEIVIAPLNGIGHVADLV